MKIRSDSVLSFYKKTKDNEHLNYSNDLTTLTRLDKFTKEGRNARGLILSVLKDMGLKIKKNNLNKWIWGNRYDIKNTIDILIEKIVHEVRESDLNEDNQYSLEDTTVASIPNYIFTVILDKESKLSKDTSRKERYKRGYNRFYNFITAR